MQRVKVPFHLFLFNLWIVLVGAGIFFMTSSCMKELELIYNSAKLEVLERSFAYHPGMDLQTVTDEDILYTYLVDEQGQVVSRNLVGSEFALEKVNFPAEALIFKRRYIGSTGKVEVLELQKILRRGQNQGERQGLVLGFKYAPYRQHETRALLKYLIMFVLLIGLISLFLRIWQRWQKVQAEMVQNEWYIYTGKLSRQIAHEIKNPLGVMQATLDYLKELDEPELIKAELADIDGEVQRLNRLVDKIRSFARNERPQLQEFDLEAFLHSFLQMASRRYMGLVGSLNSWQGNGRLKADPDQLLQVLFNLVQNAEESYPDEVPLNQRKILLGCRRGRHNLEIFVQDWGAPISDDIRPRLFEPFITNKAGGSGLGLAISQQIMEAHGGELQFSEEEGSKRFTLVLPLG